MKKQSLGLRIITAFFIAGILSPSILLAADPKKIKAGPITYQEIGDAYISSFGIIEQEKPKEQLLDEKGKKKLNLAIPVLSEHEKRHLVFEILSNEEAKHPITTANYLIDNALRITLKDLDVYYGSGENPRETLMSKINNTQTMFGDVQLAYLLAHPVVDNNLLQKRQALIKELVENEGLAEQLELLLQEVKRSESGFLSFWNLEDPVTQEFFQKLYWSKLPASWNTNPYTMEAAVRLKNFGTFFEAGGGLPISMIIAGLSMAAGNYFERKAAGENITYGAVVKEGWQNVKLLSKALMHSLKNIPKDPIQKQKLYFGLGLGSAYIAFLLGVQGYQSKVALSNAREIRDAINYMQTRLIAAGNIVDSCKHLQIIAKRNDKIFSGISTLSNIDQLLEGANHTQDFVQLINLLQTNTFKDSASFFSLSGRVLAAYRLMINTKDQFASIVATIGELDACLSMARLYKKMQNERVGYSFVNFVGSQKPCIDIVDFWNPFVSTKNVVTNSISLGANADASKVILTGSNTGGKSTILKGIMIDLLLGHTFGIAAATECTLTPFAFIGSYLRVNDDTALGESKFKAEVMRAKMLSETMELLPKNQFGFIVIDELFTGTGSIAASNAAAKVAQKLAGLENNLFILATHFPALTELEKNNSGLIKNYKVEVYKDEQGNLVRPFKLEPGVSTSNVANDILNEEISGIDFNI